MKRYPLHIKILIGMLLGLVFGITSITLNFPLTLTVTYIKPIGTLFINSLKMVAIPLVFSSLLVCVAGIQNTAKISTMGSKAILIYTITTLISGGIGVAITNLVKPGRLISEQTRIALLELYKDPIHPIEAQQLSIDNNPLQFLINMIPDNFLHPFGNNDALLQVVFLAIFLGIALLKISTKNRTTIFNFFDGIREAMIECIRMIMQMAPLGIFALTASLFVESLKGHNSTDMLEVLYALLGYLATVIGGLLIVLLILYPIMLRLFSSMCFFSFLKGIYPAQLLAFSSSSSSVALPVSIQRVQKKLGISKDISNFILPLGATINMNGTALYQAVICVFIAQAMGIDLSLSKQFFIIGNIALSSLGIASAPGASLVVTIMLLESLGIPSAGLSLVLAPDRILDMCRTVVNITGDALTAVIISEGEEKKYEPK